MIEHNDAVMVTFSKAQVRHCKTAHFLKQFGPDALPEGPALAANHLPRCIRADHWLSIQPWCRRQILPHHLP